MTHALLFNRSSMRLSASAKAEPRPLQATRFQLGHTPIDASIQKMDVDGDGGRRESGLRGQRRGTESDKGTAANSLSGYHAPGLKKTLACPRPWS